MSLQATALESPEREGILDCAAREVGIPRGLLSLVVLSLSLSIGESVLELLLRGTGVEVIHMVV